MVDQDAPAGKAGIKEHDVIVSLNGAPVESKTQLHRMIHETPGGRVVTLGLSRDGQPLTIKVQLADRSKEFAHGGSMDIHMPTIPNIPAIPNMPDFDIPNIGVVYVHSSMRSGVMVENLTPQLGEFFGAKSGNGVLVRSVEKGSRADKAGLRAGDVITWVGDQSVHDTSDFTHALRTHGAGSIRLGVIRDRKEQNLTITLPERKDSGENIQDSADAPEMNAETQSELSELTDEIARLRPQMELANQVASQVSDEFSKSLCSQQKKLKAEADKVRQEINPTVRQEMEKSRQLLQQQMERFRHQMQGDWLDI
jgi:membrane-associated protease RseP (regulator of RpoE activity)